MNNSKNSILKQKNNMLKYICISLLLSAQFAVGQNKFLTKVILDTTTEATGFEVLDDFVGDKRMVFSGENHGYSRSNNTLKYKQAMYLYDKGFRFIAFEFGEGLSYLCNAYVTTGEESYLRSIFNTEYYEQRPLFGLLDKLEKFNREKEIEDKIKLVGLDYTRYPTYSLTAMMHILKENKLKDSFPAFYEDISVIANVRKSKDELGFGGREERMETFDITLDFHSYRNKLFQLSIKKLIQDYKVEKENLQNALGENAFDNFDELMSEIEKTLNWYEGDGMTYQIHTGRERHIAERLKKLLEKDSTLKISGQFGRCHIRNREYYTPCYSIDLMSFVERIQKDSLYKDEVVVMPIAYKDENEIRLTDNDSLKRIGDLLPSGNVFIYKTSAQVLEFQDESIEPEFYYINTMFFENDRSYSTETDENDFENYKEDYSESIFLELTAFNRGVDFSSLNNDLGINLLSNDALFYGIGFASSSSDINFKLRVNFMQAAEGGLDSSSYRYTNWSISETIGGNSIFSKHFTLYHGFRMDFGFSKLVQVNLLNTSNFVYGGNVERRTFKNPYINLGISTGFQVKFSPVSIFGEASYMFDVTNKKWRSNGNFVQSSKLNYSGLELRAGILFYYRDFWGWY